ncbi:MAG: hypothetical protein KIS96_14480 [Bauldia sp.]|nr:hypothetical protein [Bauldia sp.]
MANERRDPVGYRPFRAQPLLAEGLLAVSRDGGGDLLERVSAGLFRLAAEAGQVADRQAERAGRLAGEQAALAGRVAIDPGEAGTAPATGGRRLTGTQAERAGRAKAYLMSRHGLSNEAASGLVGQFAQESGFDTRARNPGDGSDGSDSIGIAQWNGRRAQALRRFAAAAGRPVDDFETQLDFVMHELRGSEIGVGRRLLAARSVEEATAAAIGYERPQGWTPQNPSGGHGWANRLAAARSVYGSAVAAAPAGVDPTPTAAVPARARPPSVSGGGFRPSGADTVYGRAYDEAGARTYVQMLDTEMRSTAGQLFDRYRDDPVALTQAYGHLRTILKQDHVFPEIEADFETGFGRLTESYLGQARDNLARKHEAADRADFITRTAELATEQQRMIAGFDPANPDAAEAIAAAQGAIDAHYDDAVRRGVLDPDAAARAKIAGRREAATGFYLKQAEALDATGVASMREAMRKDFAEGGIEGLDGDGWAALDTTLKRLEDNKRAEAERDTVRFGREGDQFAARVAAGFGVDQAAYAAWQLKAGESAEGKAALAETEGKIAAARRLRDLDLNAGRKYVEGLRKALGDNPSDAKLREYAFAADMLEAKAKAIATDSVSYAEATGIVPATPLLTEAGDQLAATVTARVDAADEAGRRLGVAPRYLKAGEARAIAAQIRANPETGAATAAAIVEGAGKAAPAVLSEFGADAPMVSEAGAILAFGGSARAAEDVILGYGKGPDGKQMKGLKPDAQRESFAGVTGDALSMAPKDRTRIDRAAAAIARKRIADEGLDPDSPEAADIHARAVHEAAGGQFDGGQQWGGFTGWGGALFSRERKVLVPPSMRADLFGDAILALTDADFTGMAVKPVPVATPYGIAPALGLAATLANGTPVAVDGGYAFAYGSGADPQFVRGSDGKVFVLDIVGLRGRLAPRVPGAFR